MTPYNTAGYNSPNERIAELQQRLTAAEAERDRAVAAAMVAQSHTDESLRLANESRQRLAAAEALWEAAVQFEGSDWADHIAQSVEAEKGGQA